MQAIPVLILTQDPALWQLWQALGTQGWMLHKANSLLDLAKWRSDGNELAILDSALPDLPRTEDPVWGQYFSGLHVLVLSSHLQDAEGQQMLLHGASGYAHKNLPVDALSRILRSIQDGSIWMGRNLLRKLLQDIDARMPEVADAQVWKKGLTLREIEVAELAAVGQNNAEIALALHISERTVRAHLSAVFEKLAVVDRLQLALTVHGVRKQAYA